MTRERNIKGDRENIIITEVVQPNNDNNVKRIAELFGVQRSAVTKHLKNIFESDELKQKVVCSISELTTQHGTIEKRRQGDRRKMLSQLRCWLLPLLINDRLVV